MFNLPSFLGIEDWCSQGFDAVVDAGVLGE